MLFSMQLGKTWRHFRQSAWNSAARRNQNSVGEVPPPLTRSCFFEAGLRAQGKQNGGKGCGRPPPSKPGKRAIARVHTKGETQKRGRGRPRKQV